MSNTSRIAKNTLALYFRQILIMLVSLYTVRVVLNTLGAQDYGIYNVVAGVVVLFSFLGGAMATASQRFFSFEMGKNESGTRGHSQLASESADKEMLSQVQHDGNLVVESVESSGNTGLFHIFCVTLTIYAFLSIIIFILAETLGLWFVGAKLVIPPGRMVAAKWIYQCAVISFLFTLMTTPYMSAIIAHENMNVYAYVGIVEVILKLLVVFVLQFLDKISARYSEPTFFWSDKLILYGILLLCVAVINTGLYRFYCKKHYKECRFKLLWDKEKFLEMFSYVGWNLFGSAVGVFKNQLVNILLNQFFGAVVNAARAIAQQVSAAVTSFSQNFSTAIRPQIIKTYAAEQKEECLSLTFRGCRMTFFLMYIFTFPLVLEMPFVLNVWLKNPPENAVIFASLVLIDALIDSVSYPIMTLAQATGKIKLYQSVVGGLLLLNFPVSYVLLKCGLPAYSVLVAGICITFIAFVVRLFIVKLLTSFSLRRFFINVCLPIILVALLSAVVPVFARFFIKGEVLNFICTVFLSVSFTAVSVFFVGMSKKERASVMNMVKRRVFHA